MATTPIFGWRLPDANDPPSQMVAFTEFGGDTEATVKAHQDAQAAMAAQVSTSEQILAKLGLNGKAVEYGAAAPTVSGTGGVTVPYGYTFAGVPLVLAVIGDENSAYAWLQIVNASVTATQFAARVYKHDNTIATSGLIRVNWIAIGTAA